MLFKVRLKGILRSYESAFVLFSGGLDSGLLLNEIHSIIGNRVQAVTFVSPLQKKRQVDFAREFTRNKGIKHIIIDYKPLEEEGIVVNSLKRCYLCKRRMFSILSGLLDRRCKGGLVIDGSHIADDPSQRPGMKANVEFGVISPWRQLGIEKAQIREMAKAQGFSIWNKPSDSCLATRFPYNYKLTVEDLGRLEAAEDAISDLGIECFRLRPVDIPPRLSLSANDYSKFRCLGIDKIYNIISEKTGWDLKDLKVSLIRQSLSLKDQA